MPKNVELFQKYSLKEAELPNRLIMAPMTRLRAYDDGTPSPSMAEYYRQRASAGLIVTECTMVSPLSHGYMNCPGIFSKKQANGWTEVTKAAHAAGGRIFLQLWHSGRISHPYLLDGKDPVAPSPVAAVGDLHTPKGKVDLPVPRELKTSEIPLIVDEFRSAAKLALEANFDGVEIHGAFGYLIDQFLQDISNERTDAYGGSIENRTRFMEETVQAVCEVFPGRTGIKLSPSNKFYGMGDSNPVALFSHVLEKLNSFNLAYVHLMEPAPADIESGVSVTKVAETFRGKCNHVLITNGGYNRERAEKALADDIADLVSFGRPFIGNPDLPHRLLHNLDLNEASPRTFYGQGPESLEGYTDYLASDQKEASIT